MQPKKTAETIETTERSLDIVREVQEQGGATIGEIAAEFDISKSTAYKHLATLNSRGYLVKEGDRYQIGLKFANRGEYARARKPGYRIAARKVDELAERTDEEVDFVVENDGRAMTVHLSYDPNNPYQEKSVDQSNKHWRTGTYYNLHCIAAGKAVLSTLPDEEIEAIIERWGLPERTNQTITDPEELYDEIETIRDRGWAYSEGEYVEGLAAIAMPVYEPNGDPLGALAVNGPAYNLQGETRYDEIRKVLSDVVASFEAELEDVDYPDSFAEGRML
ncbi:IclR family transcriptional regulator [Halostella sp. JP-L12]|uniref:IclR family transcriptional regulator n=1 Tax=Halostella TaxID=1843185 RepID=UPI000EF7DE45|nr:MULTISPECIES: IclR family transcriptional regulator [Halostella]NHN49335.1 IclR family transcriptional regulator [Halostella sp. JP-L12]